MVAFGRAVKRADSLKQTHQSMDTVSIPAGDQVLRREVHAGSAISGDRQRLSPRRVRPAGASFVSLPMDIVNEPVSAPVLAGLPRMGAAAADDIQAAVKLIRRGQMPGIAARSAGQPAGEQRSGAPSAVPHPYAGGRHLSGGGSDRRQPLRPFRRPRRLFNNQPADQLLQKADWW